MILFKKQLTISQIFGSGLALILIFLLLYLFREFQVFLYIAIILTILLIIWPLPFKYFGIVWFAFGEVLGYAMSRLLLSAIYLLLVIPVGFIKRGSIRNNMALSQFRKNTSSVFKDRSHTFTPKDFLKPF